MVEKSPSATAIYINEYIYIHIILFVSVLDTKGQPFSSLFFYIQILICFAYLKIKYSMKGK